MFWCPWEDTLRRVEAASSSSSSSTPSFTESLAFSSFIVGPNFDKGITDVAQWDKALYYLP